MILQSKYLGFSTVIDELIYNPYFLALLYYAYFLWPQLFFVLKNIHCN